LAVARGCKEALELPVAAGGLTSQTLCQCPEGHRFNSCRDIPLIACLLLAGLVFEPQVQCRQSGGCVAQGLNLGDTGSQDNVVFHSVGAMRSAAQACSA